MAWPAQLKLRAQTASQATWLVPPAHGWVRTTGRWFWRPLVPALALLCASITLLILQSALWPQADSRTPWWLAHGGLWAMLVGALLWLLLGIKRRLHEPLAFLRAWASRMRRGDLSVRLPVPDRTEFGHLARDINKLSDELQLLTEDMDRQVRNQTARLAQKNQSLEILYDVAASLSTARDLDQLLSRFLQTLMKVVNARAAAVRLLTPNGRMRLVASIGLDKDLVDREQFMPADCSTCGSALAAGTLRHQQDLGCCSHEIDHPFFHNRDMEMIVVPLQYRDRALGVYNLFTDTPNLVAREDIHDLLISIGRHLGMAVEKTHLDAESQRLALMQERNMIAHELHDSLAQTLASLRIQAKMLGETLQQDGQATALDELARITKALDGAYGELRALLLHCRAPMDKRGLLPAIEGMAERLRVDTGINVFFQKECQEFTLPPELEVQVLHIVQECLTNIRKYSQARNVRVLLQCDAAGQHRVLVEDDGIGIVAREGESFPGEHLGLNIMQERAQRLNGTLTVESEPGEGTRVALSFRFPTLDPIRDLDLPDARIAH